MSKSNYDDMRERCNSFDIIDCVVRNQNCFYILFEQISGSEDEPVRRLRLGRYYSDREPAWGYKSIVGFYQTRSCVLSGENETFVSVEYGGGVVSQLWTGGSRKFEMEDPIPLIQQVSIYRVRSIAGRAYAVGTLRSVFRRDQPDQWTCLLGNTLDIRDDEDREARDFGFSDIGGFAEDDIYACGGEGDLWHFNGKEWNAIDLPTNEFLNCLCCADNGLVYIGGQQGALLEGRGDEWRVISLGAGESEDTKAESTDFSSDIVDLAWFKDRLYIAASLTGLAEYIDGAIQPVSGLSRMTVSQTGDGDIDPGISDENLKMFSDEGVSDDALGLAALPVNFEGEGVLSPAGLHTLSTDGHLLMAGGSDTVVVFDGRGWRVIYSAYYGDEGESF